MTGNKGQSATRHLRHFLNRLFHGPSLMPRARKASVPIANIEGAIHTVRGERVILDADLATLYGIPTKVFNQAVRRNQEKFPSDFMFRLTRKEAVDLQHARRQDDIILRSQTVTLRHGRHVKHLPLAFTEHGAIMAANILHSPQAIQMSVFVVRAFVRMRGLLTDTRELARKLGALEKEPAERLDSHEAAIVGVLQRIMLLLDPPPAPETPSKEMGFHAAPKPPSSMTDWAPILQTRHDAIRAGEMIQP